jgi:hypothetical protein
MTIKNILLEIKPFDRSRRRKGPGDMGYKRMKKYLQIRFKWLLVGYIPILEFVWRNTYP